MRFPGLLSRPLVLAVFGAAALCMVERSACAARAPVSLRVNELPTKPFVYKAESRKLPDVLQDFAATLELPVIVAEGVEGTVNGKFNLTPASFLDLMSSAYGLTWYYDGNMLFVYPARANQSKVLFLRDFGVERIERLLQALKLGDRRFPLRYDPAEKTLVVSGPPRHIELVESMVDAISERGREEGRRIVRVFPLRFASSSDQTIGGATVTGMVSMLNQVYGAGAGAGAGGVGSAKGGPPGMSGPTALSPMTALYGASAEGMALQQKNTERSLNSAANAFSLGPNGGAGAERPKGASAIGKDPIEDDRPMFTSDDANNAVIVMGLPHRMVVYAELIKQLDVASDLIELEATIIDVEHDDVTSIGIDWTAKNHSTTAGYTALPTLASAAGSAFQLTTLSADLSRQLLLSVNALQRQGRARIIARPRVVGVANRLATMKDTRSASVRVAGNLSSNLYSLETGTQIEVIPRKIQVEGMQAIRLALSIQDGAFDNANTVDSIPIVKRTMISTEAYVGDGEGLLIGGISSETDTASQAGLPGVSRIPFFGALFRAVDEQSTKRERLFLITPRVISIAKRSNQRSELPGNRSDNALAAADTGRTQTDGGVGGKLSGTRLTKIK